MTFSQQSMPRPNPGLKKELEGQILGFGISPDIAYTTVSHERRRIRERMEEDSKLKRWHKDLELLLVS